MAWHCSPVQCVPRIGLCYAVRGSRGVGGAALRAVVVPGGAYISDEMMQALTPIV
jgi:hypothetical protein